MRDMARQRLVAAGVGVLCSLVLGGAGACARQPADTGTPVPTFASSAGPGTSGAAAPRTGLPDDCAVMLTVDDLGALFGLPVGSVALRSIRGVPAPSVGRTERLACGYTRSDANDAKLLDVNVGRFTDEAAADGQWRVNSAAERSDGTATDLAIGDARAVLVARPAETTLLVVYRLDTYTLVLPAQAAGGRPPQDVLVDLAKRVIRVTAATMPPPSSTAPPAPPVPSSGDAVRPEAGGTGNRS